MSNDERVAVLETTINHIDATLNFLRQDIGGIREDIRDLNNKSDSNFKWLLTIIIGGFVGTWGVLSHVLHWV